MSAAFVYALGHFVHFLGFALGVGGSVAAARALAAARRSEPPVKAGLEASAAEVVTKVELPGLFIALAGGILLIVQNPNHLKPAMSGAGPWLHVKLAFVLGLLIVSHLRMFRTRKLVKERAAGANEAECDEILRAARTLGNVDVALAAVIILIATFRVLIFA